MQFLVVDESAKKSWRNSRRILAAHLYRRGSRTFTGQLSKEGLNELVIKLKAIATKNSSIAIYKLTPHLEFVLITRIGNTKQWGEEGWFSHTMSQVQKTTPKETFTPMERLLRLVTRLAALFHDIGKANNEFQEMLYEATEGRTAGPTGQHMRHDIVSYLMLQWLTPEGLVKLAECPKKCFQYDEPLNYPDRKEAFIHAALLHNGLIRGSHTEMVCTAVKYLVLTHHRQLAATIEEKPGRVELTNMQKPAKNSGWTNIEVAPSFDRHINQFLPLKENNQNIKDDDTLPWHTKSWLDSVKDTASGIIRLFEDHPFLGNCLTTNPQAWADNVTLIARPALIQADHLASAMKKPTEQTDGVFANTTIVANKKNECNVVFADLLYTHLLKTKKAVDPYFKGMTSRHDSLPVWNCSQNSSLTKTTTDPRFKWQDKIVEQLKQHSKTNTQPFFGMVISSTGAGKTLAAPKMLNALNQNMRYTCGLGLRSLTLQTGRVYREMLQMDENDCMTIVGDTLYAQLQKEEDLSNERMGSESLDDFELADDNPNITGNTLREALGLSTQSQLSLKSGRTLQMTEVPVLVCTTDYLMRACSLENGSDTKMSLRLASADLVLDEVDNYNLEDLVALGRLCYHMGVHGRRVIVMSATVSSSALKGLYDAWSRGIKSWQWRQGLKQEPLVALVSNQVESKVFNASDNLQVYKEIDDFTNSLVNYLNNSYWPNKQLNVPVGTTINETYELMLRQALNFARVHHTVNTYDSSDRLSAGFIRFNRVKDARAFTKWLVEEATFPPDVDVKVQCYHRRMPLFHLAYIEREFNKLWNRKDPQELFESLRMKKWHKNAKNKLRVVIVSTTSIQETGRDHDYDWAIAEPWSTRSFVQLSGRVRRHRVGIVTEANVAMLEKELKAVEYAPKNGVYKTSLELSHESDYYHKILCGLKKGQGNMPPLFPRTDWFNPNWREKGIHAGACLLKKEDAYLSRLEQQAIRMRLDPTSSVEDCRFSLKHINYAALSWGQHCAAVVFRRSSTPLLRVTLDPSGQSPFTQVKALVKSDNQPLVLNSDLNVDYIQFSKNPERLLMDLTLISPKDVADRLGEKTTWLTKVLAFSTEVYKAENVARTNISYHPNLGMD